MTGPWHTAPSTIPPQPAPATPPNKKVVDSFGRPLASWPKRLAAYLIDAGPLFATFIIASFFMDNLLTSQADTLTGEVSSSWAVVAIAGLLLMFGFIFLFMVYEVICHGSERGQTIGKSVMKLQLSAPNPARQSRRKRRHRSSITSASASTRVWRSWSSLMPPSRGTRQACQPS